MVTAENIHLPVMAGQVLEYLAPAPGACIVDATVGLGGHSREIARRICPGGRLICVDRDEDSLQVARQRLEEYAGCCDFVHGNFADIDAILQSLHRAGVDGMIMDLGLSMYQLQDAQRGFSFQLEGPLDMRFDRSSYISAYDLLNNLNEDELSHLLRTFGEERWHNRIARYLVQERRKHPIATTQELSEIVVRAIPGRFRHMHYRIHPATRTFQAVRIAVNREMESLETCLDKAVRLLNTNGRICVISFHSLEDRVVKHALRRFAQDSQVRILTPKPLTPGQAEVQANPASRSAKLRAAERL